jgi:hypothetical protein
MIPLNKSYVHVDAKIPELIGALVQEMLAFFLSLFRGWTWVHAARLKATDAIQSETNTPAK